jgi:glycosyltransferase involved in cell wall biosynthesis
MKVLVLSGQFPTPRDPVCGMFVVEQIKALRKLGVEITVVAPTPWAPRALRFLKRVQAHLLTPTQSQLDDFEVHYLKIPTLPGGHLFSLSGFFLYFRSRSIVRRYLERGGIDLIHAHTVMPEGFAAVLLGKTFKIPVVCTAHGSDVKIYPWKSYATRLATKWAVRKVDRVIAVSDDLKEAIFQLAGVRQVYIAKNGADAERFKSVPKDEARVALGLPRDKRLICFVGNLFPVKGVEFLLNAVSKLDRSEVVLYLLGDGYLRVGLIELAKELGIGNICHFMGQRQHQEIPIWLSAADCLVLPSLSEGLPTVISEAMMCGVPVVATAVGGTPEIIRHRETGLLVPPKDSRALVQAIIEVLTNQELANSMRQKALIEAQSNFSWERNAHQTLDVYRIAVAHKT